MSKPGHLAAVTCYQNGNYRQAANRFNDILSGEGDNLQTLSNDNGKRVRDEESDDSCTPAGLLSVLAVEADATLCHARSVICDSNVAQASRFGACQKAIDANSSYRRALYVAVDNGMESLTRQGDQQYQYLVSNALLASVSSSWLYLQLDNLELAWQVVCDTLSWAASSFQRDSHPEKNVKADREVITSSLTTKEAMRILTTRMTDQKAVRSLKHCLNILNLRKKALPEPFVESGSRKVVIQNKEVKNIAKRSAVKEQLVQALYFHKDLYSSKIARDSMRLKRDACLKNAVATEVSGVWDGNIAKGIQSEIYGLESLQQKTTSNDINVEQMLEQSVGPFSIFQARHNLLGCVRAKHRRKLKLALDSFQQALKLKQGSAPTNEIISNAAECFLCLGETTKSKRLLYGLLKTKTEALSDAFSASKDTSVSLSVNNSIHSFDFCDKVTLLWRLFVVSDLDEDCVSRTAVAETLWQNTNLSGEAHAFAIGAYVFSLLQSGQVALALDVCKSNTERFSSKALSMMLSLYEAECKIITKMGTSAGQRTDSVEAPLDPFSILFLMKEVVGYCNSLLKSTLNNEAMSIHALINNNKGLAFLVSGKESEALSCFQEAVRIQSRLEGPFLNLQPFFNLALLQWKKRQVHDAIRTWLSVRGLLIFQRSSNPTVDLSDLHQKLECAIRDYDEEVHRGKISPDAEQQSRNIGGIKAVQVLLADIIFLQCSIQLRGERIVAYCEKRNLRLSQI